MSRLKDFHTPVFWAEGHPGKLNREGWVIEVSGLCANPETFTWQELIALPKANARGYAKCAYPWEGQLLQHLMF